MGVLWGGAGGGGGGFIVTGKHTILKQCYIKLP